MDYEAMLESIGDIENPHSSIRKIENMAIE